ncbi:MAG: XTP/dITP diphosphatase [Anaerolineae bacterium]
MRQLFYATTNPGKVMEVRQIMRTLGLDIVAPADLGMTYDVPEPGTTLEENALFKARAYLQHLPPDEFVVIADDTGVEIDALGGEPGIRVRRWIGEGRMSDEAIITYCLARLDGVPPERRGAQFRTVIAVGTDPDTLAIFEGTLRGVILEQPDPLRIPGFPFESIFYVPEWKMLLGQVHQLPADQKARYLTHRERALRQALPRIHALRDGRWSGQDAE